MRYHSMAILIVLIAMLAGCTSNTKPEGKFAGKTIVVCAGAGLMKPMNELIKNFQEQR